MTSTSVPENEDPPTISCGHSDIDPSIVNMNTNTSITSCPDVQAQFPDVARDSMFVESDESTSSEGDSRESADNGDEVFFGVSYVFIAQEYNYLIPTSFLEQHWPHDSVVFINTPDRGNPTVGRQHQLSELISVKEFRTSDRMHISEFMMNKPVSEVF